MNSFIWTWAKRFKAPLSLIAALSLFGSITTLIIPWLASQFLGGILEADRADLTLIVAGMVVALSILALLNIGIAIASEAAEGRILEQLRTEVYDHVQLLPLEFHHGSRQGDLFALITTEVQNLSWFLTSTLAGIPALLLTAFGSILALFWIDQAMALIIPIMIPVFFILAKLFGRRLRVASARVRKAENDLIDLTETNLGIVPAIKTFAREEHQSERFAVAADKARRMALDEARLQSLLGPISAWIAAISAIGLIIFASEQLDVAQKSPESLFAFILYAALLTRPIGQLANVYGNYRLASATLSRFKAVLGRPQEHGYSLSHFVAHAEGDITFENLSFGYSGRPPLFTNFSLSIDAGSVVAITGDNGAGKSTLVHLLLGLYSPQSGRITLDGQDIANIQVQSLRRQFGVVPQRALLFNGTILENITLAGDFAACGSVQDEIERALRISQAEELIGELPDGLNTRIGDNGVRLSGGQRQRIALARALLKRPPIIILDEATSMYDSESEAAFIEACVDALQEHTVILITHREKSLAMADRVVKLEQGTIAAKSS